MCKDINIAETLANKIEYLNLTGDIGYTMKDFYAENGIAIQDMLNSETIRLIEKAQNILEARRGLNGSQREAQ